MLVTKRVAVRLFAASISAHRISPTRGIASKRSQGSKHVETCFLKQVPASAVTSWSETLLDEIPLLVPSIQGCCGSFKCIFNIYYPQNYLQRTRVLNLKFPCYNISQNLKHFAKVYASLCISQICANV